MWLQEPLRAISHSSHNASTTVRLLWSLQKKQCIDLLAVTTTWDATSCVNLWYAVTFVTIGFEEILPASGWISSHSQKQRVTPEEPEEFPSHLAGGYSGWSLALSHENCLKLQALKPDVITLESAVKRVTRFPTHCAESSTPSQVYGSFWGSMFAKIMFQP